MPAQSAEIVATQWNHLPTFGKVKRPSDNDRGCLDAIRDVLVKHGCLDRFGVTLLHKHFDMAPDEILVEEVHQADRTLVTKPVKVDVVRAETPGIYETQWHWRPNLVRQVLQFCVVGAFPKKPQAGPLP
jgi:hypothetical protein